MEWGGSLRITLPRESEKGGDDDHDSRHSLGGGQGARGAGRRDYYLVSANLDLQIGSQGQRIDEIPKQASPELEVLIGSNHSL